MNDNLEILVEAVQGDRKKVFARYGQKPSKALGERTIRWILRILGGMTIAVTATIVYILVSDAIGFFSEVSFWDFITGTQWEPFGHDKKFGVLPLLSGTLMIAIGASAVAIPFGLGTAIYLTQYAPALVREVATPVVEILGGIPTVVYGYFALVTVTPILKAVFGQDTVEVFNALSASIVVGISILPMVSSLSADSLRVVPISIKNAGYALGMSKFHVITKIAIPAAFSGVVASFILAFARAVGETMAVTLAAGATPTTAWDFFHGIQTMTAFIVQISLGDASAGSIEYFTRYALGLTLFILTFGFNFIATRIVRRFREVYQ
ncbi:MAG: phosphate ABC transporter permease subunit PstC [Leptospiraceae bacterium]|nr:phosphate ABC transporter permease subunit PstC [Leptospiraceae bacterium]